MLLGDLLYHGPRNDLPRDYAPKRVIPLLNALADRIIAVRGNCDAEVDQMVLDFPVMADYATLFDETGRELFLTHGHVFGAGMHNSVDHAPALPEGSALVYGHTHIKVNEESAAHPGLWLFNPGSVSIPKDGYARLRHLRGRRVPPRGPGGGVAMAQHMAQQNAEGSRDLPTLVDASAELQHLVQTIWRLRQPDGCPWDREQTHRSIGKNMIEEAYEALDCVEADDAVHLREELGDVLMQVVLHAQIAADAGEFTLADVARDIDAKLIRRHPHVFGDADADSSDEVLKIWDEVKLAERAAKDKAVAAGEAAPEGLLDGVPTHLPALMQAQKVSRKAAAVGFEWETVQDVWDEVAEERAEFEAEAPWLARARDGVWRPALCPGQRRAQGGDRRRERPARQHGKVPPSLGRDGADGGRCPRGSGRALDPRPQRPVGCRKGGGVRLRERRADTPHRSR